MKLVVIACVLVGACWASTVLAQANNICTSTDLATVSQGSMEDVSYRRGTSPLSFRVLKSPADFTTKCSVTLHVATPPVTEQACQSTEKLFPAGDIGILIHGASKSLTARFGAKHFDLKTPLEAHPLGSDDAVFLAYKVPAETIGNKQDHTLFFYLLSWTAADGDMPKQYFMEDFDDSATDCRKLAPDINPAFKRCSLKECLAVNDSVLSGTLGMRGTKKAGFVSPFEGEVGSGTEHKP